MKRSIFTLALMTFATTASAECGDLSDPVVEFEDVRLINEYNATDGDIGVHGEVDADGWSELCLYDPYGSLILHVRPDAQFSDLGLAQLFFESREPAVDEWGYEDLKAAFPEGDYRTIGRTHDGRAIGKSARFTTIVPAMPEIIAPTVASDSEAPDIPVIPLDNLTVIWSPVGNSLDGRPIEIVAYQLIVTNDDFEEGDAFDQPVFSVHLSAETTDFVVQSAFFSPDAIFEIEVLAIEESGNQTIGLGFVRTKG